MIHFKLGFLILKVHIFHVSYATLVSQNARFITNFIIYVHCLRTVSHPRMISFDHAISLHNLHTIKNVNRANRHRAEMTKNPKKWSEPAIIFSFTSQKRVTSRLSTILAFSWCILYLTMPPISAAICSRSPLGQVKTILRALMTVSAFLFAMKQNTCWACFYPLLTNIQLK